MTSFLSRIVVPIAIFMGSIVAPAIAQDDGGDQKPKKRIESNDIAQIVAERVGKKPIVVQSEHFRIVSMFEQEEAKSLLDLAERIHEDYTELIEEPEDRRYWNLTGDLFIMTDQPEYVKFVSNVMPLYTSSKQALDFFRKGSGCNISTPAPVSGRYRRNSPLRNATANVSGRWLLQNYVGPRRQLPAFLIEGFAEYVEFKYEKSCRIFFQTPKQYGGDTKLAEKASDSSAWPELVKDSVIDKTHTPFSKLKHTMVNELDFEHLSKSWSLLTFLVDEHEEKFVEWVRNMRKMHWEEALYKAYKWTNDELDREWEIWVKAAY